MPDFFVQYYLVILIIVVFVLFAVIGYLSENLKKKEAAAKLAKDQPDDGIGEADVANIDEVEEVITSQPIIEEVVTSEPVIAEAEVENMDVPVIAEPESTDTDDNIETL